MTDNLAELVKSTAFEAGADLVGVGSIDRFDKAPADVHPHSGRAVRENETTPDGMVSLRVMGCAAGLGELGLSKVFLTPQFGPRQRISLF